MKNFTNKMVIMETGDDFNLNIGDESYFASMVDMFKREMPGVKLLKFSHDPQRIKNLYGIDSVYQGGSLIKRFISTFSAIKQIKKCDVYCLGGGQIICDPTIGLALVLRLSKSIIAIAFGKKVMGYALGVGPLNRNYVKHLIRIVFNKFSVITVRDEHSKKLLEDIGVKKHIPITADPAVRLNIPSRSDTEKLLKEKCISFDLNKKLIIISPYGPAYHRFKSVLPAKYQVKYNIWPKGGEQRFNDYIKLHVQLCDYFVNELDANVLFLSMDASKWHGRDDYIAKRIIEKSEHASKIKLLEGNITPKQLIGIYSLGSVLVGSRLHSTILASTANVPYIAIAFEEKTRSYSEKIGMEDMVVDSNNLDFEDIITRIKKLLQEKENYKEQINKSLDLEKKLADENVLKLKKLLEE